MRLVAIYLVLITIGFSSCQKVEIVEPQAVEPEKEMTMWELHLSVDGIVHHATSVSTGQFYNENQLIGESIIFSGETMWISFRYQYNCKEVFMRGYINGTSFIVNNPDCSIMNSSYKNSDPSPLYSLNFCNGKSNVPVELRVTKKQVTVN